MNFRRDGFTPPPATFYKYYLTISGPAGVGRAAEVGAVHHLRADRAPEAGAEESRELAAGGVRDRGVGIVTGERVALVTGAARGQGAAIVKRLLEDGFRIAACDLRIDELRSGVAELRSRRAGFYEQGWFPV